MIVPENKSLRQRMLENGIKIRCSNCRWHDTDNPEWDAYICVNGDSPYCSEWTDDDDYCEAWEAKNEG